MALWSDALESHLCQLDARQLRRLCEPRLQPVVDLVPRLSEILNTEPQGHSAQRQTTEALSHVLRRLAAAAPVLIVLDDVHLADGSSWKALERLASELAREPILVVLAARPPELGEFALAGEVLSRLEEDFVLRRVSLPPLEADQVAQLALAVLNREGVGDRLVDWLMARSWGNPLYAIGLLRALLDEGADFDAPSLRALPEGLAERIRSRLARLDRGAAALLELLAVFGRPATAAEIVATAEQLLPDLIEPIEALIDSGLAVERDQRSGDLTYDVAHPMMAQAIYHGTTSVRRRVYHRQIAKHLQATGRLAEASSHLAHGAELGDADAVDALQSALQEAGRLGAYPEAHAILGALANVLPADDQRWLRVFDALSDEAQWILDHRSDADAEPCIQAMQAIDALLSDGADLVRRGVVKLRLSSLYSYGLGDVELADAAAAQALALFEASGDRTRALLAKVEMVAHRNVVGDLQGLEASAARLLAEAEDLGDPLLLMHVTGWLALGRSFSGEFAEANGLFRRSAQIASDNGESFHQTWSQSVHTTSLAMQGDLEGALSLLGVVERENLRPGESIFHECASIPLWAAGRFPEVLRHVDAVLSWQPSLAKRRGFALPFGAMAAVELARWDTAHAHVRAARELYREGNFVVHRDLAMWAEAVVAGLTGRLDSALDLAKRASARLLQARCRAYAGPVLLDVAEFSADLGDSQGAHDAAAALNSLAADLRDLPFHRALALLAAACTADLDHGKRVDAAIAAAQTFDSLGYRTYAGRAYHRLGEVLARAGDVREAHSAYRQAREIFTACGSVVRAELVQNGA